MIALSNCSILIALADVKGFIATKEANDESQLCEILNLNPLQFTIHEDIKSIEFIKGIPSIKNIKEKGRSFSKDVEIKWQKLNGKFCIVALSENKSYLNSLDISSKSFDVECVSYMLWGGYKPEINPDKNIFIEVRIPKCLKYPIPAMKEDERLYIKAYHYIEDEIVQFTRYRNLMPKAENQKGAEK